MASPSSCRFSFSASTPSAVDVHAEAREDLVLQALDVPIVGTRVLVGVLVEQAAENVAHVILKDQFFLIESFQQLAAQAVDGLALLVHHVVVFEQVFAGLEVLAFDRLLRRFNAPRDHLRLDRERPLPCPAAAAGSTPTPWRRCASGRLPATDRSAKRRDRPDGRRVRATGCRCGAPRDVRCRR